MLQQDRVMQDTGCLANYSVWQICLWPCGAGDAVFESKRMYSLGKLG
jgi:hypothetical protein